MRYDATTRRTSWIALVSLALGGVVAGCRTEDTRQSATEPIERAGGFAISPVPVLEIEARADGPYVLSDIGDATRLSNGWIAVADGMEKRVVVFDSSGGFLKYLGRGGAGPSEFAAPRWIEQCAPDTLHVYDMVLGRMTVLDREGNQLKQVAFGSPPFRLACNHLGDVALIRTPVPSIGGDEYAMASAGSAIFSSAGDSVASLGRVHALSPRALGEAAVLAVGRDMIVYGSSEEPIVEVYDLQGVHLRSMQTGSGRRAATDAHHDAAIDAQMDAVARSDNDAKIRKMLKMIPMPELLPAYRDAFVDPKGNVWVVTSSFGEGTTELRVLPGDEASAVTLRLPKEITVLEVGESYLLAKADDASGVARVVLFSVTMP